MTDWYKVKQSLFSEGNYELDKTYGNMFWIEKEYGFSGFFYESLKGRVLKIRNESDGQHEILVNKTLEFRLEDQLEVRVVDSN